MKKRKSRALTAIAVLVVLAAIAAAAMKLGLFERKNTVRDEPVPDWVDVQLIDIDGASRRGVKLEEINDIVVHYVGNPGTTAQQNRNYFNNPDSEVSSHFVIGLDGEVTAHPAHRLRVVHFSSFSNNFLLPACCAAAWPTRWH